MLFSLEFDFGRAVVYCREAWNGINPLNPTKQVISSRASRNDVCGTRGVVGREASTDKSRRLRGDHLPGRVGEHSLSEEESCPMWGTTNHERWVSTDFRKKHIVYGAREAGVQGRTDRARMRFSDGVEVNVLAYAVSAF